MVGEKTSEGLNQTSGISASHTMRENSPCILLARGLPRRVACPAPRLLPSAISSVMFGQRGLGTLPGESEQKRRNVAGARKWV